MTRRYLVSVADIWGYEDSTGTLLFSGKTLLDSSIETTLGSTDVRGGKGNQLLYVYYHTADMAITISDAQWNLDFLANTLGQSVQTSSSVFVEETITLVASSGTVTAQPLVLPSGTILYGWVTHIDGYVEKVTFSTKTFTCSYIGGGATDTVCVRFYATDAAARFVNVPANAIPKIVHLVLEAQLCSSDDVDNQIGVVQIDIPNASLSGGFSISMTPDGVATTPLAARAFASQSLTTAACSSIPVLAKIIEILTDANWYDDVLGLSIAGGDFSLATTTGTKLLSVWAIPTVGAAFQPPVADLTFASGTTAASTVAATGLVTGVAAGTSTIKVSITADTTIDANVICTTP